MIETRYHLERKSLTHGIVYIEPEREYGYEIEHAGMRLGQVRRLIYYDIDPNTGNRTGRYYRASDLFKTEKECNVALRKQIKENIKNCRKEIYKLEKQFKDTVPDQTCQGTDLTSIFRCAQQTEHSQLLTSGISRRNEIE